MERQLINAVEHAAQAEVEHQLSYSPEFSHYSLDHEVILRDVLNHLPPHYPLFRQIESSTNTLSFFQRERLRQIVYSTIRDYIGSPITKGKTPSLSGR